MFEIFLSAPDVAEAEAAIASEAVMNNCSKPDLGMLTRFEKALADYTGFPHVAALSSGTAALHLALLITGVGKGDEVWTSSMTFMGGVSPITFVGATPVFVDLSPDSWTIDCDLLEDELKKASDGNRLPKAILATDLYGQTCDMERLSALCSYHGVVLVSDSAETLGAFCGGKHAGHGARVAGLSFNVNKIITTFGGGALLSDDKALVDRARYFATQARQPFIHYQHTEIGYNYRLSDVSAAIGVAQLGTIEKRVERRREIFSRYAAAIAGFPGVSFMPEPVNRRSTRWLTCLTLGKDAKAAPAKIIEACKTASIETRPLWKPMHMQPVFEGSRFIGPGLCETFFATGLCLPSGSSMSNSQQDRVIAVLSDCLKA